ncbi:MAG: methyl-accepting chemotaxis protein [Coleofasciculaceae cyanobacterium]
MFADFFKKIQNQLLLLLVISAVVPVSLVGGYSIISSTGTLGEIAEKELAEEVEGEAAEIREFLKGARTDISFLSNSPEVQGLMRAKVSGGQDKEDGSSYEAWLKRLENSFIAMLKAKEDYQKFRYIDENGQEILRVEKDNSDRSKIIVVPQAKLQDKSGRAYFSETIKLSSEEIYISSVALEQEEGKVLEPYQPEIHYATPVVDPNGQKRGILVSNIFADQFLDLFQEQPEEAIERDRKGQLRFITNQDGYYLSHPNEEKEWGFDLGKEETIGKDYSEKIAEQVLSGEEGVIDIGSSLLAYYKFTPNPDQDESLFILEEVPESSVFTSVNSFKLVASLIILISLATVLPLGIFRGRQIVDLIKQLVTNISSSSQQIFSTLEQQERIAGQQATSVNETTTTMDELEVSCRQSSEQARAAVMSAQKALELAQGGTHAVGETLEGMFTLEKKVEAIAEQIVFLSQQADQIAGISELVSDFANQTNMLALNSSVEAVRAGEHGKGFAVVANEVRKLSEQSQKSADKINVLVSEIQKAINSTVMVTEEGTKTVKSGVQIARRTDQAFSGVTDAVNTVVVNNQQISLNLKQQVDAMQQVVLAMDAIAKGSKETVSGIAQTKVGTGQLKEAAVTLDQMV